MEWAQFLPSIVFIWKNYEAWSHDPWKHTEREDLWTQECRKSKTVSLLQRLIISVLVWNLSIKQCFQALSCFAFFFQKGSSGTLIKQTVCDWSVRRKSEYEILLARFGAKRRRRSTARLGHKNLLADFVHDECWEEFLDICRASPDMKLDEVVDSIKNHPVEWRQWMQLDVPIHTNLQFRHIAFSAVSSRPALFGSTLREKPWAIVAWGHHSTVP